MLFQNREEDSMTGYNWKFFYVKIVFTVFYEPKYSEYFKFIITISLLITV